MLETKTIVDNAMNSKDHTTLVSALNAAGLVPILKGKGPFTVFAPTNAAFAALPPGTLEPLLKPENKQKLATILTCHVFAGVLTQDELVKRIKAANNKLVIDSVAKVPITFRMNGTTIEIYGPSLFVARITTPDVVQSNGLIHVVDRVLLP